jgi:hypothetical protein
MEIKKKAVEFYMIPMYGHVCPSELEPCEELTTALTPCIPPFRAN